MRVIDCDRCGETIQAATDEELERGLQEHYRTEHDEELAFEDAEQLVDEQAYDATDS